ncbi:MAG: SGNH/GDSL hydrolase family protein [Phormidesmis sp.]
MKIWILLGALAVCLAALAVLEVALRLGFGFGNPPLYVADEGMGYVLAPNQRLRRFGNRIHINEYAMRSAAVSSLPAPDTLRLLLLGDSLANGSWWTDQADILSARIAYHLQAALPKPYQQVEALNASANSWGPRNELAYLERYGTFGAGVLILMLNTDDLFGTQPTSLQVGRDRSYPSQKPSSAIAEVIGRYLKKNQPILGLEEIQSEGGDRVGKNLDAISAIHSYATATDAKFILVLSPLKRELPGPRDYEIVARTRLKDWATAANIPYLDLLPVYQQHPDAESLYRDHIHLSPVGNELVSEAIAQVIPPLFP